jgi:hypothetical protein
MSQRRYTVNHPLRGDLEVTAGWDRPLQYSFLVVRHDDDLLYSNLMDPDGCDVPPAKAREILERLGVPIPVGFIDALERDRAARRGNLVVTHLLYTGEGGAQFELWKRFDNAFLSAFFEDTHAPVFAWVTALDTTDLEGAGHCVQPWDGVRRVLFDERDGSGLRAGDVVRVQRPQGLTTHLEWTGQMWLDPRAQLPF